MMFMITIPPTPSDTDAMSRERMNAAAEICRQSCWRLSGVTTPNGSGARKSVWRSARSTARTSSTDASTPGTPPRARTTMSTESRLPHCRRQDWMGMMTVASWLWPSVRPCLASRPITR